MHVNTIWYLLGAQAQAQDYESFYCPVSDFFAWGVTNPLHLGLFFNIFSLRPSFLTPPIPYRWKGAWSTTPSGSPFTGHWQLNKQTTRYVTCVGVKIPSQVDFDLAKTFLRGESDKGDKSESGLHPEGGDDRHKVIMILLRSHRPSVESGTSPPESRHTQWAQRDGTRGETPMIS